MMRVYFDLDGTLCTTPADIDHDSASELLARCEPRWRSLEHVQDVHALGHEVGIITARGRHVQRPTLQQLGAWLGDLGAKMPVHFRPRLLFDMRHYVADKEAQLRKVRADVYVGDRPEDRAAALRAGARFLWDHEFFTRGLAALRLEVA